MIQKIDPRDEKKVSSQKLGGNRKTLEGAKRPTAGDEPREFTSRGEGGRVPPFIEKLQKKWFSSRSWAILFLLFFVWGSVVSSQSFQEVRKVLVTRDKLNSLRQEVEKMATINSDSIEPGFPDRVIEIKKELTRVEDEIQPLKDMRGPLAAHYFSSLVRQIHDNRNILEKVDKRLEIHHAPPPVKVVTVPLKASSIPLNASSIPLKASSTPDRLLVDPHQERAMRKNFFHPIWPRMLIPRFSKPQKDLEPPLNVVSQPTATPKPKYDFPLALPKPVSVAPKEISPLIPGDTNDPQVRKKPGMRPLAIMVENHRKARPQTGLGEAEVVYEIPVEGGITRFMGLFYHIPKIIGPVRSCRDYFIDRALEVNALYVHCGGSPQGYKYIAKSKIFAIDEISYSIPFFRDKTRGAPHNLYAKVQKVVTEMDKRHPMQLPYQKLPFLYGERPTYSITPNAGVSIRYHGNYNVTYTFNPKLNVYDRYMNGEQHLDRVSLYPVSPGTVIIQEAAMKVIDEVGRQDITFIGQGNAFVLSGGTVIRANWKKTAPREFTHYFDEKGKPLIFSNKKPIWIQVVAPKLPVAFNPPLPEDWMKDNLIAKQ